jgi:arylsulfatase A-like enzyme
MRDRAFPLNLGRAAVVGLALLSTACGGGQRDGQATPRARAEQRLQRLSLVEWASGAPALAAVSEGEVVLALGPGSAGSQPTVRGGALAADGDGRLALTASESTATVRFDGLQLALADVDELRVELELPVAGTARVTTLARWPGRPEPEREVTDHHFPRRGANVVTHALDGRGTLEALELELPAGTRLGPLQLRRGPMRLGASPRTSASGLLDAGLGQLEAVGATRRETLSEARRTLPSRAETWSVAPYDGGGRPLLYGALALPRTERVLPGPVEFELWVRPADDRPPPTGAQRLLARTLDPGEHRSRWFPFVLDLPGAAGESYELLALTRGARPAGSVDGLWAEPVLVRRDAPRPPDLVLVTADTLRADHLGAQRRALGLPPLPGLETPFLDGLAARGLSFTDCLATSNATSPSHATILTGHFPRDHRVRDNSSVLAEGAVTLAEVLREQYFCVASVTAGHLNPALSGLGQGFDVVLAVPSAQDQPRLERAPAAIDELPPIFEANQVHGELEYANPRLERFLAEAGELPLFLWLHYFDPHTPYRVQPEVAERLLVPDAPHGPAFLEVLAAERARARGRSASAAEDFADLLMAAPHLSFVGGTRSVERVRSLYAAGVSELDAGLAQVDRWLAAQGRQVRYAVTADHGESLGERDIWFSHDGLYANTLQVPLILAGPGLEPRAPSKAPVSTIDLLPTLCQWFAVPPPPLLPGQSLLGELPGPQRRRWFQHSGNREIGFREGQRHVIYTVQDHPLGVLDRRRRATEVEFLELDPAGHETALEAPAEDAERARLELRDWMFSPVLDLEAARAQHTEAQAAELIRLGYRDH